MISEIVKDSGHIPRRPNKNLISLSEVALEKSNQTPQVFLLGAVIEGKDDEIGCDEEDDEERPQA